MNRVIWEFDCTLVLILSLIIVAWWSCNRDSASCSKCAFKCNTAAASMDLSTATSVFFDCELILRKDCMRSHIVHSGQVWVRTSSSMQFQMIFTLLFLSKACTSCQWCLRTCWRWFCNRSVSLTSHFVSFNWYVFHYSLVIWDHRSFIITKLQCKYVFIGFNQVF